MPRKTELEKITDLSHTVADLAFHEGGKSHITREHADRIKMALEDIVIICSSYPAVRAEFLELIAGTKPKNGD